MKLRVLAVSRDRQDPICLAAAEMLERVRRHYPIELVEVKEEPARGHVPVDKVRAAEAARLDKALAPGDYVIALDEQGKELSSTELARRLSGWASEGRGRVCFLIGGPHGLDRALLARADERWALSRLTLPHRLARLVLAEQIYRATTIVRGEPYHK